MFASLTSAALAVTHIALNLTAASPTLFDGCVEVGPGPTCFVAADTALVIWTSESETTQPLFNGRALVSTSMESVAGGIRYTLSLPQASGTVTLLNDDQTSLRLEILTINGAATIASAHSALQNPSLSDALTAVNKLLRTSPAAATAELLRTKARLHTRQDEHNIAQGVFRAAIASARANGQHYTAVKSAAALAFSLRHHQRDTRAAQNALESVADLVGLHGASNYLWFYHRGMVAFTADNARQQLRYFEQAASVALQTNEPVRQLRADTRLAVVSQLLGQRDEAGMRLGRWTDRLPENLPGCERAVFFSNLGWNALLQFEAQERPDNPIPDLDRALELSDQHCATTERINARLNLALAHWHQNDLVSAEQFLVQARSLTNDPATHLAYWAMDIDGRILASRGDFDAALTKFETLAERAEAASQPATRWRAHVRQAWTLQLAGRTEDAIKTHRIAERALDEQVLRTPLQAGRESLLTARRFAMRNHLSLLLEQQRFDLALALIRRESGRAIEQIHIAARIDGLDSASRAQWEAYRSKYETLRAAASFEQEQKWQLSRAQLEQQKERGVKRDFELRQLLDEGFMTLLTQPTTPPQSEPHRYSRRAPLLAVWQSNDGWAILIDRGDGVIGVTPNCPSDARTITHDALATCLLQTVTPHLSAATTVSLLADDLLADVDWHTLPFENTQWIDRFAIRYVSGLSVTSRATPGPGLALIVGDPENNLRAARAEASSIQERMRSHKAWRDDTLLGSAANMNNVRSRLSGAALFHYAGHAVFGDSSGWDAALLLANETQLGIGDILTLERTPQLVVLSGCETARGAGIATPIMGLAHAFLASGSSTIIATTRSVDDTSARTVMGYFYDHWLEGQTIHESLRSAQIRTRDQQPELDWSAFRIIEP